MNPLILERFLRVKIEKKNQMLFIGTFYGIVFFLNKNTFSKMFTCAIEKKQTN